MGGWTPEIGKWLWTANKWKHIMSRWFLRVSSKEQYCGSGEDLRGRRIVQSVQSLLNMHEDQSLVWWVWWITLIIPALGRWKQEDSWGLLASQPRPVSLRLQREDRTWGKKLDVYFWGVTCTGESERSSGYHTAEEESLREAVAWLPPGFPQISVSMQR